MDQRTRSDETASVDARMNLAAWLRAGRDRRNLTIEDVAKITKIQPRILEKLESGSLDGLPAEVFVKGFVRSFAKCVGLDESEAINKYSAAQAQPSVTVAQALADTIASSSVRKIAPRGSSPAIVVPPIEAAPVDDAPVVTVEASPVVAVEAVVVAVDVAQDAAPVLAQQAGPVVAQQAAAVVAVKVAQDVAVEVAPVVAQESAAVVAQEAAPVVAQEAAAVVALDAVPVDVAQDAAPVQAQSVVDSSPILDAIVAVETAAQNSTSAKKKRSRKNSKQRRNKKKQQELAAVESASPDSARAGAANAHAVSAEAASCEVALGENAVTTRFSKQSIETGPVAKIDGESLEATSIEAKTSDSFTAISVSDVASEPVGTVVMNDAVVEAEALAEGSGPVAQTATAVELESAADANTAIEASTSDEADVSESGGTWQPTMPPITTAPSVPWRRPNLPTSTQAASTYVVPTLVIDDADPDSAERVREDRIAKEPHRLSFLPPILLDREDRSARQGGLTLAVIILLIAATLTLSYLMRRPSPSGDGVTMLDGSSMLVG